MNVITSYIRSRIAGQTIDPETETTVVNLVTDSLPAEPVVADIDLAITRARKGFGLLFKPPLPKPVDARPRVLSTVGGVYPTKRRPA